MHILIIGIFIAVISYLIVKKRAIKTNDREMIKSIIWIEACAFLIVYFITNNNSYKISWLTFMFFACVISLIPRR